MNFTSRIVNLFINPERVFADIKEKPDYYGIFFTGFLVVPLAVLGSFILQNKIKFEFPSYFPQGLLFFFETFSLFSTVYGSIISLGTTWIFITVFVFILAKIQKKDVPFKDLLPPTSYVLIPITLNYIADLYYYSRLTPITINVAESGSTSRVLEITNQLYTNIDYFVLHILVLILVIIL